MYGDCIGHIRTIPYPRWLICLYNVGNLCGLGLRRARHAPSGLRDCSGRRLKDVDRLCSTESSLHNWVAMDLSLSIPEPGKLVSSRMFTTPSCKSKHVATSPGQRGIYLGYSSAYCIEFLKARSRSFSMYFGLSYCMHAKTL